jgi:hypothetical protein
MQTSFSLKMVNTQNEDALLACEFRVRTGAEAGMADFACDVTRWGLSLARREWVDDEHESEDLFDFIPFIM